MTKDFKEGWVCLGSELGGQFIVASEAWQEKREAPEDRKTGKDEPACSAGFLLFPILICSWSSAHDLVPTTFTLGLPPPPIKHP